MDHNRIEILANMIYVPSWMYHKKSWMSKNKKIIKVNFQNLSFIFDSWKYSKSRTQERLTGGGLDVTPSRTFYICFPLHIIYPPIDNFLCSPFPHHLFFFPGGKLCAPRKIVSSIKNVFCFYPGGKNPLINKTFFPLMESFSLEKKYSCRE